MKTVIKQNKGGRAFTIVELLTIMSIIIILLGLLVPALNKARRFAKNVKQRAQFHSIEIAMDLFNTEWETYPPSDAATLGLNYCGAMNLANAMVGEDMLGYDPTGVYNAANLSNRSGPYVDLGNSNATELDDLDVYYGTNYLPPRDGNSVILCDVYTTVNNLANGKRVGMPILYYRADTSETDGRRIYDANDNQALVHLNNGNPLDLDNGDTVFKDKTTDKRITIVRRPHNPESYILMSAGFDGLYGTGDDIFNFQE